MKIISVQFRADSKTDGDHPEYRGREYSYFADVDVGDEIVVPTKNGQGVARVCRTDVKESQIDERVMPYMRTIEKIVKPEDRED